MKKIDNKHLDYEKIISHKGKDIFKIIKMKTNEYYYLINLETNNMIIDTKKNILQIIKKYKRGVK